MLWSEFETMRPALFAAFAEAATTALHRIRDIDLGNVARFPDCAIWAAAAAPALGLDEQSVVDAFTDPDAVWIGSDPLRDAVYTLLRPHPVWKGDATALLNQLRAIAPSAVLPASARGLSQVLDGIAGLHVDRHTVAGLHSLTITRTARTSEQASPLQFPG